MEISRKGGSAWGTRVHPWQIHVDVWQNQYNIVLKKKSSHHMEKLLLCEVIDVI